MPSKQWTCTVCNRTMQKDSEQSHLQGLMHRSKVVAQRHDTLASSVWKCTTCDCQMDISSREEHLTTRVHRSKVAAEPWTCSTCRRRLTVGNREDHLRGKPHQKAVQAAAVATSRSVPVSTPAPAPASAPPPPAPAPAFAPVPPAPAPSSAPAPPLVASSNAAKAAVTDRYDLIIEGDFNFNIVGLETATRGVNVHAWLKAKTTTSRTQLIDCTLASSRRGQAQSPFTVTVSGKNRTITYYTPVHLQVHVAAQHYGHTEDRLELTFEDLQLSKRFIILCTLDLHVGSQEDQDELKPKVPYTPRDRNAVRQPEIEVIPGELPPPLKAIPYVGNLPFSEIPSNLVGDLSSGSTSEIVGQLQMLYLPPVLDSRGHGQHFKHLLWAEEYQMEHDMGYYDMPSARLRSHNQSYYLEVPGLAEKRPSVLVGDKILVQPHGSPEGRWYEGGVHSVRMEEVGMKFHRNFAAKPTDRFLVRFKLNRIPLRREHKALDSTFAEERVLFPEPEHLSLGNAPQGLPRQTFNAAIATNPKQLQAVTSIVHAPAGSPPFVIFGPPGTGKTVTLVETIRQILASDPEARVLACAPSNSAADLIALRLRELGSDVLFRAYAPSRPREQIPDELERFTYRNSGGYFSVRSKADVKKFRVVVTTCISSSIVSGIGIPRGHYSHICIDEAGQATEPEVMVAVKLMAGKETNVVLCGDPKQLGPIVRSGVARRLGLGVSYIERLMGRAMFDEVEGYGISVVKLTRNYRSHAAILRFPNEQFYGGDLEPCADRSVTDLFINSAHVVSPKFPIVFHSVFGKDAREASSPSYFNIDEVTVVKSVLKKLKSDPRIRLTDDDIGVIAPYRAQVLKLRAAFRSLNVSAKVGSVEEFQGQERKVIIVTTVRSSREFVDYDLRHTLGFVANPRRFNVAVTRAQALLVIVGDPNVLSLDPLWRSFLNYVHENGGWTGPEPMWDTAEQVDFAGGYDVAIRDQARAEMEAFDRMMEGTAPDGDVDEGDVNVDQPWGEAD